MVCKMINLSTVLSNIAKSIVDHPEKVVVTEQEEGNEILLDKKPAKKYVYTAKFGDSFFKYEVIACINQGSIHVIHITYMQDKVAEGQDITYSSLREKSEFYIYR